MVRVRAKLARTRATIAHFLVRQSRALGPPPPTTLYRAGPGGLPQPTVSLRALAPPYYLPEEELLLPPFYII